MIRIKGHRWVFNDKGNGTFLVINLTDSLSVPTFYYETKRFRMRNLRKAIHRQCDKHQHLKRNLKEKETKAKKKMDTN